MTSRSPTDGRPAGRWQDDPAVRRLLTAHVVTYAGTSVSAVAMPVLAYQLTDSARHTAVLAALSLAPYLVLGIPLSALADRADRRRLMVIAELTSGVASATIPLASVTGNLWIGHLYAVTVVLGIAFVLIDAANFGAMPAIAGHERLADVLTWQWTVDSMIQLAGPVVAGGLVATIGSSAVPALDAASFLASALLLSRLRRPFRDGDVAAEARRERLTAGMRFIWCAPTVRSFTLLGVGNSLTIGATVGVLVPFAVQRLRLADDDARLGVLYAAAAAGGLVATRLLRRLRHHEPTRITRASLPMTAAAVVLLAQQRHLGTAALVYGLAVVGSQVTILNGIAYRQRITPDHLQGRVNVLARMIAVAGQPIGAVVAGAITGPLAVQTTIALGAMGAAASGVLALVGPLRLRAPVPGPAAAAPL